MCEIDTNRYCFNCSWEGDGSITDPDENVLWKYKTKHSFRPIFISYGLLKLPPLAFYDIEENEVLSIVRNRRLPLPQFNVMSDDSQVGTIKQRNVLPTKYQIELQNGDKWTIRIPPFKVLFQGVSRKGKELYFRLWSHNVWLVEIDATADSFELVASLAFIHRERLRLV